VRRRVFQWFLLFLSVITAWAVFANILSDDAAVRTQARAAVNEAAGCGADCKLEGLRGDRGMFEERIEYDVAKHGHYVVVCRRAFIAFGDYHCEVTEKPAAR
jgi:hypothetical protein